MNKMLLAFVATVTALACAMPSPAVAKPFNNGDLFVGRAIRPDTTDQFFDFGMKFSIAPVKAIIKSVVKKQMNEYAAQNPEAAAMQEYVQYADTQQMRDLANSGQLDAFKQALKDEMTKNGAQLSAEQTAMIDGMDEAKLKTMADMIDIVNEEDDTLTFALEPWVAVNFKYLRIKANVAIAGFSNDKIDMPSMQLGNLGLELSTGASHGEMGMAFGWTVGVRGYAPTGTEDANLLALSNITAAPRFFHEYATVSPFAVIGMDFSFLQWSVHGEFVNMMAVRQGDTKVNDMAYVQAGTGVLVYMKWAGLSLELDGLFNVKDADAMGGTWLLTSGVRTYLGPANIGVGVQIPLAQPGSDDAYFAMGGVATGSPAAFNFMLDAKMRF
ncbi:MAG: hypothetical protein KC502_07250 [Myxococcales bacterium]|nr:hypothetical protein [Myxococcales bacterium]